MKSVAVVVPAYNEELNIIRVLTSLVNQTHTPAVIIVVNDGSTDNTALLVEAFQKNYNFVHLLTLERSTGYGIGYASVLRTGKRWLDSLPCFNYDFLMVCDADQQLSENYIELCAKAFITDSVAIVGGSTFGIETRQPRGAHRLLAKWFVDKHPVPLAYATDSRHYYIALKHGYIVKVVKEALANEYRQPHGSHTDYFWKGTECHRLGYTIPYLLGRIFQNSVTLKHIQASLMLVGFFFSLLKRRKKFSVCNQVSQYQKLRIKKVMMRLLP